MYIKIFFQVYTLYIHENSIILIALKKVQLLEYCSAIKKDGCLPFKTTWMDLESIMLIEISETGRQILCDFTKMCDQKNKLMNITKKKQTHRCREQASDYQ